MERNSADGNTPDFRLRTLPWKRIGAAAAAAALLLLLAGIVVWLIVSAPDIDTISVSPAESATYICDADGNYLRKLTLAESNRDIVTLEQIPDSLEKAMIAIEDERFYEHGGIDPRARAQSRSSLSRTAYLPSGHRKIPFLTGSGARCRNSISHCSSKTGYPRTKFSKIT